MAHGGCFGVSLILIFCIVAAMQNQSRAYNVQACESIDIVAALWATERQVCYILSTPLPMPSGVGFFIGGLDVVNLTPKQEKFAQCVADGMTQADAYRVAYDCAPSTKAESIQVNACKLMADQSIKNRVRRLRLYAIEAFLQKQADSLTPESLAELAELAMQDEIKPKKQDAFSSSGKINRYAVFYAANFKCQACGASPSPTNEVTLHVDHILPKSKGGTDDPLNLQALCADCNLSKSNLFAYDHTNEVDLWKP